MSTSAHNYAVIMAGGIGSRFWPMSRAEFPKQFHDILGTGRTLIQMTFDRLKKLVDADKILVVTNADYKELVAEQLPEMKLDHILCEPFMRNTAPCIAYAAFHIQALDPKARMIVAPADHLVMKEDEFVNSINLALEHAETTQSLMTLGIKPSRPDTGYGYIQFEDDAGEYDTQIRRVKTFTEKPNVELAKQFVDSGEFYWNSGIFIWTLQDILASFETNLPDMYQLFAEGKSAFGTEGEGAFIGEIYGVCENVSIDYGIMEKSKKVGVVLSDFGWSDLGTWGSLYTHLDHDAAGNGVLGDSVRLYDAKDNVVRMPDGKTVVIQGLEGCIVVESNDTLLICKKDAEQSIKQWVNDIKLKGK